MSYQKEEQRNELVSETSKELKGAPSHVDGSTTLYDNGQIRLVPAPSQDPNDPLNLSKFRKGMAIASVCFFGAIAIAMQQIISGMLPVFMLVYAGIDPKVLNSGAGFLGGGPPPGMIPPGASPPGMVPPGAPSGAPPAMLMKRATNPLQALQDIPGAQPLSKVNLLSSLPVLIIGLFNYFLIPLSVTFGRRAVLISCSLIATLCMMWAGLSTSLPSHLGARCIHALGAGAVESLIPLVVQDLTFIHQRSTAISLVWASQGIISISLGVGSNYIVSRISWRWLYFIGSIITAASFVMIVLFVPETRWHRSRAALRGEIGEDTEPHPENSGLSGGKIRARIGLFNNGGIQIKNGCLAFLEIVQSLILPIVIYMIFINAAFIGISLGSNLTLAPVLLAPPYSWSFNNLGLIVVTAFIASIFIMLGGWVSDWNVNRITKKNSGRREAEYNLYNLIFPLFIGILGCILYGVGGQYVNDVHWMAIMTGTTMLLYAFLTCNIIASVVSIESYPQLAGPVLVNVSSFRNIVGFGFTYGMPDWVADRGYMGAFGIFAGVIALVSIPLPLFILYGKRIRQSTRFVAKEANYLL